MKYFWFEFGEAPHGHFYSVSGRQAMLLFLCLAAGMASAGAQVGSSTPTSENIVARMAQARAEGRARLRPYIVTRSYKLCGKDEGKSKSEVIANIAFVPPDSKKYSIQETNGSGLGQILVRRMLVGEAEAERKHLGTDLSAENYHFRFIREENVIGQRCYVLELLPRRNEQYLLRGDIWVDAETYLPLRFEGEFAKSPSWWVRNLRLTFVYSEVGGMWLQTSTQAAADVRILGLSTMVSRDLKYKITDLVAAASSMDENFIDLTPHPLLDPGLIPRVTK
jgi:outer membrane lipoprotein-sorting protein